MDSTQAADRRAAASLQRRAPVPAHTLQLEPSGEEEQPPACAEQRPQRQRLSGCRAALRPVCGKEVRALSGASVPSALLCALLLADMYPVTVFLGLHHRLRPTAG